MCTRQTHTKSLEHTSNINVSTSSLMLASVITLPFSLDSSKTSSKAFRFFLPISSLPCSICFVDFCCLYASCFSRMIWRKKKLEVQQQKFGKLISTRRHNWRGRKGVTPRVGSCHICNSIPCQWNYACCRGICGNVCPGWCAWKWNRSAATPGWSVARTTRRIWDGSENVILKTIVKIEAILTHRGIWRIVTLRPFGHEH